MKNKSIMQVIEEAWQEWESLPHNSKWARKIEGTPIRNDLTATIARKMRELIKQKESKNDSAG